MKKFFLVGLMTFAAVSYMAAVNVATFENEAGGINLTTAESAWQGADEPVVGNNVWTSGDFQFTTIKASWGGYQQFTVTNETTNTSTGSAQPYRSAKGGAFEGSNFVVWNYPYADVNDVTFTAQVINGFYVNNTAYAVTSMSNGDAYAKKFEKTDWFKLTITGYKSGAIVGHVDFDLAKDGKYVNEWTYVDLSSIGEIDAVRFSMTSSDTGGYGMNTPAYFAMDNFGATKPAGYVAPDMADLPVNTGFEEVETATPAQKFFRDGQIYILRDGKTYTITGAVVK